MSPPDIAEAGFPGVPPSAIEVFGTELEHAVGYAHMLATRGVEWGVIGPREVPRLWDRHLLNCAVIAELVDDDCGTLIDVGSGAGLPGIVLAMLRPRVRVTLVEPLERRVKFLGECVSELGLANVDMLRSRAEDAAGKISASVVTARAVAPLDRLAPLMAGMSRRGGMALAIKGSSAPEELAQARPALKRIGARGAEVLRVGHGKVEPATTVVRFYIG